MENRNAKKYYEDIYKDLKMKIEDNTFAYQELLPPENTLIQTYGCSPKYSAPRSWPSCQ